MATHMLDASPQQLLDEAKKQTDIFHIEDDDIKEPLERLIQSLNNEAQLTESGVVAATQRLIHTLSNRLRIMRDFEQHPEINDVELSPILFLTGGPRTGSTKLHKMLAATGDFHYLKLWHSYNIALFSGDRNEDPKPRIESADKFTHWFNEKVPHAKMSHFFQTHEPEEETFIVENSGFGLFMMPFFFVPSFVQWYAAKGYQQDFEFLKKSLKYLQWQFYEDDPKPWVFKNPGYCGLEPELAKVFPASEAKMACTHRNPTKLFGSGASLIKNYHTAYSDANRDEIIGMMVLENFSVSFERASEIRQQENLNILDISYQDLLNNDVNVITSLYSHMGMEMSSEVADGLKQWSQSNGQHKHGKHKYALSDFGLSEEVIAQKCNNYMQNFQQYF